MFNHRRKFQDRKDIRILQDSSYYNLRPDWFIETLVEIKERYSKEYPEINVAFNKEGYVIFANLSPEQIAKNEEKTLMDEYERLKDEFEPEPDESDDEDEEETVEEESTTPVSWIKKLFRR